ncbi:hypothetical protein D9M71_406280 [compost metagenome]
MWQQLFNLLGRGPMQIEELFSGAQLAEQASLLLRLDGLFLTRLLGKSAPDLVIHLVEPCLGLLDVDQPVDQVEASGIAPSLQARDEIAILLLDLQDCCCGLLALSIEQTGLDVGQLPGIGVRLALAFIGIDGGLSGLRP